MLLESINDPTDLRQLSYEQLDALAAEIRQHIVDAVSSRRSGTSARTSASSSSRSPCTGCSTRPATSCCGTPATRPTSTRSSPAAATTSPTLRQAGRPVGLPVAAPSPSTTGSRTATPRRSSATPTASPRRSSCAAIDRPQRRRRHRRRLDDRRHGVRGPQQPRPLRAAPSSSSTTTAAPTPRPSRSLSESLGRLRLNPAYVRNRARLDKLLHDVPLVGEHLERGVEGALAAVREMFEPPAFFEMLGVRYTGPFDGHDIAGLERALRNAGEFDGPDRGPRAHPEGPRLRAGRERPDQAPARHGRGQARQLHRGLHRGAHQGGRAPARAGRHHRGHARLHRPAAVRGAVPRPLLRRRHRRAARRHRRRRHGDGRPAPGGRHLLDVPHPGVRPGQPRRRPARPAGGVLPRPGRHHRRRRRQPPRRARHGAAVRRCRA